MQEIEGFDPLGMAQADDRRQLVSDPKREPCRQQQDVSEQVPAHNRAVACGVEAVQPLIHRCPDEEDEGGGHCRRMDPCGKAHQAFPEENLLPVGDRERAKNHAHKKPVGNRPSQPCADKAQQGGDHRMPVVRGNPPEEQRVHR